MRQSPVKIAECYWSPGAAGRTAALAPAHAQLRLAMMFCCGGPFILSLSVLQIAAPGEYSRGARNEGYTSDLRPPLGAPSGTSEGRGCTGGLPGGSSGPPCGPLGCCSLRCAPQKQGLRETGAGGFQRWPGREGISTVSAVGSPGRSVTAGSCTIDLLPRCK